MAAQLEARLRELDAERGRVRDTIARFGDALAATHEPYALLPVIVENTVEATGAWGPGWSSTARRSPARATRTAAGARSRSRSAWTAARAASST